MKKSDKRNVWQRAEQEGFDYAFRFYSDFAEVDDPVFHHLRKAYIEVAKALEEYIRPRKETPFP